MSDKPVCEIQKNSRETIQFRLGTFKTHRFVDMRVDSYMRNLKCQSVQVDEIWCYVGKKQGHLKETGGRTSARAGRRLRK
jgi:hypothetical protein